MLDMKALNKTTMVKAPELWKMESNGLKESHPAFPYRYQQQIASSARYGIMALAFQDGLDRLPTGCNGHELGKNGS